MALVDRLVRAEVDAELIALNEKTSSVGCLPDDLVELLGILTLPGDYCLSTTEVNRPRISIKDEQGQTHHMTMERNGKNELRISGMLFGKGDTVGELLYNLREPAFDLISSILGTAVVFRRLVKLTDIKSCKLLNMNQLYHVELLTQDARYKHLTGEMKVDGSRVECKLVQSREMSLYDWRQKLFNELRVALVVEQKKLPILVPVAIVSPSHELGYLVYSKLEISRLDMFVKNSLFQLSVLGRMKLMRGIVNVMADLHLAGIFHGALEMQHFVIMHSDGSVMFNGGEGLAPISATKSTNLVDLSSLAPEIAWTRRLTPSSGVYSIGRILRTLSTISIEVMSSDPNAAQMQLVSAIVSRCLSRRPGTRPTMDGLYLRLKVAYDACQK